MTARSAPDHDQGIVSSRFHVALFLGIGVLLFPVEGFAQWYAISVWNDESQAQAAYIKPGIPEFFDAVLFEDDYVPLCSQQACPDGVANEMDWAFALWEFQARQVNPNPTAFHVGGMLAPAHPWPNDATLFWDHFVANIPLAQPFVDAWVAIGGAFAIDH